MRRALLPRWRDGDRPLVRWPLTRPAGDPLSWDIQAHGRLAVVLVDGELDVATAPGLGEELTPLAEPAVTSSWTWPASGSATVPG